MAAAAALNARVGSCVCCCSCAEAPLQCLWPGAGCQAAQRPGRPGSIDSNALNQIFGQGGPPHVCLAGPDEADRPLRAVELVELGGLAGPVGLAELVQAMQMV